MGDIVIVLQAAKNLLHVIQWSRARPVLCTIQSNIEIKEIATKR